MRRVRPPSGVYRLGDRVAWSAEGRRGEGRVAAVLLASPHGDPVPLPEAVGAALGWSLARRVVLRVQPDRGAARAVRPWAGHRVRVVEPAREVA